MDTAQLEQFKCIAQIGNMTKAANILHISQPTLSNSIKRLEAELKHPLFERSSKQISLTDFGRYYLTVADRILKILDESNSVIQAKKIRNVISIAMKCYYDKLAYAIESFASDRADISFDITVSTLNAPFTTYDKDFIYDKLGSNIPEFLSMPLGSSVRHTNYVIVPANHQLASAKGIHFHDLQNEPFIFLTGNNGEYEPLYQACVKNGLLSDVLIKTNNAATKMLLLRMGRMVSIIPEAWHDEYACERNLKLIPLLDYEDSVKYCLFYRKDILSESHKKDFFDYIVKLLCV